MIKINEIQFKKLVKNINNKKEDAIGTYSYNRFTLTIGKKGGSTSAQKVKRRYYRLKRLNLCVTCGKKKPLKGILKCKECKERTNKNRNNLNRTK